jgi:hypothetical protein
VSLRRGVAVLAALALLGACGGGGDDVDALTPEEAASMADSSLLDADDLGDGWRADGATEPDEDDAELARFEDCFGHDINRRTDDATIARSETRHFEQRGDGPFARARVSIVSVVLDDRDLVDDALARVSEDAFDTCIADAVVESAGADASGLPLVAGDASFDDDYLRVEGVRSAHVAIPFHTPIVSTVVAVSLGSVSDGGDVARWSAALADRQRLAGG